MEPSLLLTALIYLAAAAIAAPLGRRLGIGSVLGYLAFGAVLGPAVLGLVGQDQDVLHFAEFGVVLMLFVIGLELDLGKLWKMRGPIFGLGSLQVVGTAVVIALILLLVGLAWREAVAIGLILALSSTAIVMQTLEERKLTNTSSGQQSFAVLLFQDIAVIPILALLPLLALAPEAVAGDDHGGASSWFIHLPAWLKGLTILGAVTGIVIIGRFLIEPWLRWVAKLRVTEALTATTVALVVGAALLMQSVGLSPALGTFLAGVMLASSSFRHELESDIEPFKALLLAVFFLAVGAGIDFSLIAERPLPIVLGVLGLIAAKALVLYLLGKTFKLAMDQRLLFTAALAQGGEFAFVLGGFAVAQNVLRPETTDLMIAIVAISMAVAPLLLILVQRVIVPKIGTTESDLSSRPEDTEMEAARVLLVGFGRFGHPIIRLLRSAGEMPTVLEHDSDHVDFIRSIGMTCYYGDARRRQLLEAAGVDKAELLIIAVDDKDTSLSITELCQKHFPHLKLLVRAVSRNHAYALQRQGVEFFIEQLGSSLDCAISTLQHLGHDPDHAKDAARRFKIHEMEAIAKTANIPEDSQAYKDVALQNLRDLDSLLVNAPLPTPSTRT